MILGDPNAASASSEDRTTLDDIFQRAVARRPDAIALADPPNRASFTDGAPRRLTYAQADCIDLPPSEWSIDYFSLDQEGEGT